MSADVETVETALIKILDRALAISDNEICNKIPKIIEKRAEYIINNVIKDLKKKSEQLKTEMVKQFREDIKKGLSKDVVAVGNEYKKIFTVLTDSTIKSTPEMLSKINAENSTEDAKKYVDSVQKITQGNAEKAAAISYPVTQIAIIAQNDKQKSSKVGGALKLVASPFMALGKFTASVAWSVTKGIMGAILTLTVTFAAVNPIMTIALIGAIKEMGPEKVAQLTINSAPEVFKGVLKGIQMEGEVIDFLTKHGPEAKQFIDTCSPLIQEGGGDVMTLINSPEFLETTKASKDAFTTLINSPEFSGTIQNSDIFIKEYGPVFLEAAHSTSDFLTKYGDNPDMIDSLTEIAPSFNTFGGTDSLREAATQPSQFLSEHVSTVEPPQTDIFENAGSNADEAATELVSTGNAVASEFTGLAENLIKGGKKRRTRLRFSKKYHKNMSINKRPTKKSQHKTIKKMQG